jgi:probable phosphoglycerate mutase
MTDPSSTGDQEYRQIRYRRPPGAAELLLVRHGESAPQRPGSDTDPPQAQADPELDPVGHRQAEKVADRLAAENLSAIYVSTLQRTAQTAEPLCKRTGLDAKVEPGIHEVGLGEWEGGLFRKHVTEGHPLAIRMRMEERWDVIPGAESNEAFAERVRNAITAIASRHANEAVAVFTHGGVIGQVMSIATGARPMAFVGSDNGSITHIVVLGNFWIVRRFNDTAHLHAGFTTSPEGLV